MQGLQVDMPVLVLGIIVYATVGLIHDIIVVFGLNDKEQFTMKTKTSIFPATCVKSILFSVWTVGAYFMAGTLLT